MTQFQGGLGGFILNIWDQCENDTNDTNDTISEGLSGFILNIWDQCENDTNDTISEGLGWIFNVKMTQMTQMTQIQRG